MADTAFFKRPKREREGEREKLELHNLQNPDDTS